ncbi:MAG: hypothetical protein ACI358_00400 [Candidatus Limimorpha sp.]
MKRIILFVSVAFVSIIAMSCGSSKTVVNNAPVTQPVSLPCPECTDNEMFSYLGQAVAESDYDLQDARIFAAQAARDEIQAMVESVVTRSVDNFSQKHRSGTEVQSIAKQTIQSINVIKGKIKGTPIKCWGTTPSNSKQGAQNVWVCVQLSAQTVYDEVVSAMSSDETIKIDFAQEQFKDDFYRALEEYKNN